ncbi:hypothetical protein HDV04_001241 [Boothiomyces sp. JEL0838]|nr:hypothetical protein HDV04_001241 [Boothiomyces sp. JEL0838]
MQIDSICEIIVLLITVALLIIAVALGPLISKHKLISPAFRPKVWIILAITIIQTCGSIYNISNNFSTYMMRIPGMFAQWTLYMILLLNIHILQVFSVLNQKITKTKILVLKIIGTILFLPVAVSQGWYFFIYDYDAIPPLMKLANSLGTTLYVMVIVSYDTFQGVYLTYLVLRHKKNKSEQVKKTMDALVRSILFLSFMDWVAVGVFGLATYVPAITNNYVLYNTMMAYSNTHTGIHCVFMVYIFKQLTNFTFIGTKGSVQKKNLITPQVTTDMQERPTLDKNTYTGIHGTFMIYVFKLLTDFTFVDSKRYKIKKSKEKNPTQVVPSKNMNSEPNADNLRASITKHILIQ